MIATSTGTTVWRWDQAEPFGNSVPNADPDGDGIAFDFPLRFPGQYFDRETNLAYNYLRDYDPGIGRYAESDPIGLRGDLNTYAYVNSKPLTLVDLSGLQACAPPPRCHRTSICHYDGGLYNQSCADSLPAFRVCTFFSNCFPYIWSSTVNRCPRAGGGTRG
jgi:RHS repeat-associated protein